ncbi:MAG: trypsin-like peptidase domain-containing protein, partial [Planctomycetales bacterium]|nr:trypsin-like peptidase domain-containing protein [Planctomycetales bacterium]
MKVKVGCPHCGAKFNVPQSAIGQTAKCSKCGQKFQVQAAPTEGPESLEPQASEVPVDLGAAPSAEIPISVVAPVHTASQGSPAMEARPVSPTPISVAPVNIGGAVNAPLADSTMQVQPSGDLPATAPAPQSAASRRPAKPNAVPVGWIVAAVGAIAVSVAVTIIVMQSGGQGNATASSSPQTTVAGGDGELVLYLGAAAAESLSLQVDGKEHPLSAEATQRLKLAAGNYQVLLRRRGYEPIEQQIAVTAGASASLTPQWTQPGLGAVATAATPGVTTWVQSVDTAQRQAKAVNENVLALFIGSDWSRESRQLVDSGLASSAIQQALAGKFQLAVLDFPLTEEMGTQVADPAHNQWMLEKYAINPKELPILVGMDTEGLPFAIVGASGDASEFARQIEQMEELRVEHARILTNSATLLEARRAIDWLKEHNVLAHHRDQVLRWYTAAQREDSDNQAGQLGPFFEAMWDAESLQALQADDASRLGKLVSVLDQWHAGKRFRDQDRAARMHLKGSFVALRMESLDVARRLAEQGSVYRPKDADLANKLRAIPKAIDSVGQLGSGSGFVVAPGYVLTNYHVIEGPGRVQVGLSDSDASVVAQVIATDQERDLALLRTPSPLGSPLPVASDTPGRGARVAAFGYPLGDAIGGGLKLTTGVISGLPNDETEQMLLLDMRVNPGNSGGPLCNASGSVVGVVTARTMSDTDVDSYGMAIPAPAVETFLRRYIPRF